MSNIVDGFDIRKRKLMKMNESTDYDIRSSKYCATLSNNMREDPTYNNISKFVEECSNNKENSNVYIRECIEAVNEYGDKYPQIINIVCDRVIPNLDDFTINDIREDSDMMQNESIGNSINRIYEMNTVTDRILSNHDKINEVYDVESLVEDRIDEEILVTKVASIINEFDIPIVGKFSATLEELSYIDPTIDKEILVNEAYDYFCLACDTDKEIREGMKNVVKNSPVIPDSIRINENSKYDIYANYIYRDNHNIQSLIELKDKLLSSSSEHIKNKFNSFLELLTKIVTSSSDKELVKYIYETLIPGLKDEIINRLSGDPDGLTIMTAIRYSIQNNIELCNDKYNVLYDNNGTDIYQYINALKVLEEYIDNTRDVFYPSYNVECMMYSLNETNATISLQEFKLFKFDNLITRLWKADKFLQKKFNQFKNRVKSKVYKVRSKIFENSDIYEFLDINGNIDYCISSFAYSPDADIMDLHEYCTNCIRDINNDIFNNSEYVCYYEITGDTIEFRVRSNMISITLTESERMKLDEMISYEDMNRISDVLYVTDLLKEDFNFVDESVGFFSKKSNYDKFGTYLELCSTAGIDREIIDQVYENTLIRCSDPTTFIIKNSYLYDSYHTSDDNMVDVSLEAIIGIQTLFEDGNNLTAAEKRRETLRKKKEEQLRKWEEEEDEDDEDEDEEDSKVNKDKEKNKDLNNKLTGNNKPEENKKEDKKPVKPDTKGMSLFNKVKLYSKGLLQYARTAGNKIRGKVMDMTSSSDRLGDAIKRALISDNKEAIIKGSVIPSFHKCIMIFIGLAGLWAFNPPLAIVTAIGGFAVSKNLTKKERALMYDDVMIELKIVDKELQMAEDKNQIKKMRELMRLKKELERTAARILVGSSFKKDLIPGGYSINRDND